MEPDSEVKAMESISCPPASTQPVLLIGRGSVASCSESDSTFRTNTHSSHTGHLHSNSCMEMVSRGFAEIQQTMKDMKRALEAQVRIRKESSFSCILEKLSLQAYFMMTILLSFLFYRQERQRC